VFLRVESLLRSVHFINAEYGNTNDVTGSQRRDAPSTPCTPIVQH
jgi:hypothetical protein